MIKAPLEVRVKPSLNQVITSVVRYYGQFGKRALKRELQSEPLSSHVGLLDVYSLGEDGWIVKFINFEAETTDIVVASPSSEA